MDEKKQPLILDLAFDPELPEDRVTLYRNDVAGPETKTLIVYDEPFWRNDGLSGESVGAGHACRRTVRAPRE